MRFGRITRGVAVASMVAGAWVAGSALSFSQDPKPEPAGETVTDSTNERASGVILKVDRIKADASAATKRPKAKGQGADTAKPATHRVTINTDAIWMDWARDQSKSKVTDSPKKDAEKGQKSVATVGEPVTDNSVVVIDIGPDTVVETRFRAPDDETSKGSLTPPETAKPKGKGKRATPKAVKFTADDLKPGLFVEVDYDTAKDQHPAVTVSVIRPVGGPESGPVDRAK